MDPQLEQKNYCATLDILRRLFLQVLRYEKFPDAVFRDCKVSISDRNVSLELLDHGHHFMVLQILPLHLNNGPLLAHWAWIHRAQIAHFQSIYCTHKGGLELAKFLLKLLRSLRNTLSIRKAVLSRI